MSTHLVTGGAGFIGSHVAQRLLDRGQRVVVLDDLSGGRRENVPADAAFIQADITDPEAVNDAFTQHSFDTVHHLAAFAAEGISHAVKRHNYTVNILGTVNLVNASLATGVGLFVFASTVAVYGHGVTPMREDSTPTPADSYGNGKLAIERELEITMRMQGLPFVALRMHNVYGERQNMGDPYRNAVAIFANQILRGQPITVYGDGSQIRAFTYCPDIADAFVRAADAPEAHGRVLNIGASQTSTVLDMATALREAMGVPDHPIQHIESRDEVHAAYTDNTLARTVLGDWHDTTLADGLNRTAAWARAHGPVDPSSDLRIESSAGTGESWLEWTRRQVPA